MVRSSAAEGPWRRRAAPRGRVIRHEDNKWVLYSKDHKKVLGRHDTKRAAERQERAVQARRHD